MTRFLVRRLLAVIPTLLLLIFAVVLYARLAPVDAADVILGDQANDAQARAQIQHELGIDRSLPAQYFDYIVGVVHGDLGRSFFTGIEVRDLLIGRMRVTFELAALSLVIGWTLGVTIGIISAFRQDAVLDYGLRSLAILGLTIPNFALATAAVVLPAIYFAWSPPVFYRPFTSDPVGHIEQFLVPSIILAVGLMGSVMRIMRTQLLEVLRQDYIRTAQAKGLSGRVVIVRHAVRNALIPVLSTFSIQLPIVISGTVVIEQVFGLPGMGSLILNAALQKDWPIVEGSVVVLGLCIILISLVVDLSYGFIDPRIKRVT